LKTSLSLVCSATRPPASPAGPPHILSVLRFRATLSAALFQLSPELWRLQLQVVAARSCYRHR
jgi:hypothetical protein